MKNFALNFSDCYTMKQTIWGRSDSAYFILDSLGSPTGIMWYNTPSHGGFKLDAKYNSLVHKALRRKGGWYEEDCDCSIVVFAFKELFTKESLATAISSLKNNEPDAYTAITGTNLSPEESHTLLKREINAKRMDKYVPVCARGDWFKGCPPGKVLVTGRIQTTQGCTLGPEKHFIVPKSDYHPNTMTLEGYPELDLVATGINPCDL